MAILFTPGQPILDGNGKPVANAKIKVWDAGTSDEASTFSDAALSAALPFPIRTNSAGLPITSGSAETLVHVAAGANYKVQALTSADVSLWGPLDDYPPLGRDAGTVAVNQGGTGATTAAGARTELGAAAASDLTTLTSTVTTIAGERTALNGSSFSALAGYDKATPSLLEDVKEVCLQRYYSKTPSTTSLSTSMVVDTSVPTNSEGTQIFTVDFTPVSDSSILEIEVNANMSPSAGDRYAVAAIYVDGTCIAADAAFPESGAARSDQVVVKTEYTPGSDAQITISVRAGDNGGTATLNPNFGAAANTFFKIRELLDT